MAFQPRGMIFILITGCERTLRGPTIDYRGKKLGNFVRGLTLSVSGFLGMSLCMNYANSAYSPYLVPAGLVSVSLGVVGFVLMVSGHEPGDG